MSGQITLTEYLIARRLVETAPPELVREAEKLAEKVKTRSMELITVDRMWQALLELAEPNQGNLFKIL